MSKVGITTKTGQKGINRVHCKCLAKCREGSSGGRKCGPACVHPDRYAVRKRMPDGRQTYRQFGTYGEAEHWLGQVLMDKRTQKVDQRIKAVNPLFDDVAAEWLAAVSEDIEPRTAKDYQGHIERELMPVFGGSRLKDITQRQVQDLVDSWRAKSLAGQSIHNRLNVLLPILRWGGNPMVVGKKKGGLVLPRRSAGGSDVVAQRLFLQTAEELAALVGAMPEDYQLLVTFAGFVGTRPGETWELRKRNVINGHRLLVTHAAKELAGARTRGVYRVGTTKTHRNRVVWCPGPVLDAIKAAVVEREGVSQWSEVDDEALLFSSDGRSHLDYNAFCKAWDQARKTLDSRLRKLRFYDLRHTAASVLANRGASVLVVATQLGHAKYSDVTKTYLHLFPSEVDSLMGQLDQDVLVVMA